MIPVICMITDCIREAARPDVTRIAAAARAGVSLVQIREPRLEGGALFDHVRQSVRAVESTTTRVIVNDRLDVALCAGAHGVHLRADSLPATRVRAISPRGFLVGRSVHSVHDATEAAARGGLDYLVFGTVFPTRSKPGRPSAGVEELARVVSAVSLPVLAVGGVGIQSAPDVAAAGAAGFAAISLFAEPSVDAIGPMVRDAREAFHAAARGSR